MTRFAPLLLACPPVAAAAPPTLKRADRIHVGGAAWTDDAARSANGQDGTISGVRDSFYVPVLEKN